METINVSRRNFLTGAAFMAAGAAALATGCAPKQPTANTGKEMVSAGSIPAEWDDEADVVVIGYGGSGSVAGITALMEGASVIVLEKGDIRAGGNFSRSSGTLHDSVGSDVDEWVERYVHGTLKCGATAEEIRPVLEMASAAQEWTPEYEVTFEWVDQPTSGWTWPSFQIEGQAPGKGAGLFNELDTKAQSLGLDVRTSCPAKRLVQHPDTKEILGVIAEDGGKTVYIKANKGVIMACGGYEHNAEMFFNYNLPGIDLTSTAHADPNNTGDGFPMAMAVGAQLWHMNEFHFGGFAFPAPSVETGTPMSACRGTIGGGGKQGEATAAPWIIVDRNGKRFMNENFCWAHDQNHKEAFDFSTAAAFSKATQSAFSPQVMKYTDKVSDYIHLPMFMVFDQTFFDACNPLIDGVESNDDALANGWLVKADTLEELAGLMKGDSPCGDAACAVNGIDAAALAETVRTFNGYCADGADPEFMREADYLLPLSESGPYYAIELTWTLDFTEGGPKRNGQCQTIDVWGEPIPRLYNTGEFGSFNSTVYCIGGVLQAMTTGRIAGKAAAQLEPWTDGAE